LRKITTILVFFLILLPSTAFALQMPQSGNDLADMAGISAASYVVMDAKTGQILIDKNASLSWAPASLTKLVTALVVLDTKPKLTKVVVMTKQDQIAGACGSGGACIKSAAGVKFTVDGLFHAALIPSANNAAAALARSTGLSPEQFALKMNEKAKALGATDTHFNEPTGMDATNIITASNFAKIVNAAFSNAYLRKVAGLNSYTLRSSNNSKYTQIIKNTNKLLANKEVQILGAKTGYLNESLYNFASVLKYNNGAELVVVVLGETHLYSAFAETTQLAKLAEQVRSLGLQNKILAANP
jgi:D-alanyl-D-alanine carboxypeptidase